MIFAGRIRNWTVALACTAALSACGGSGSLGSNPFGSLGSIGSGIGSGLGTGGGEPSVRQAARARGSESVAVNRYIWAASLEVLSFLPVESVDPFTGVIDFGYGTPPGSGRAYRATVYITDPALDARSLNVAIQTRSGPVAQETVLAVEDAILSRARQLRIRDGAL
ncbi:DUF3576 domain-containing protein [Salibaculum griseiflavum]|uniref:DUF3576 domain-containing protein n=1 Tax=Salibaculum griseiflavum TaxID=1914409 RepID=A0A2V1P2I5_9RHOB|nr:DUF3576 domain-containing protein [Salibaculum griseiflavum]PWG15607.1 DUF3576 domain-containing protein [Salibaculum griseiflavum]